MNGKISREYIAEILLDIEKEQSYAHLLLKRVLNEVHTKDKAFVTEVVYGTLKHRLKIDYILNTFSKTPVHRMKPMIRSILRMSVYQLLFLDKVPASAVINEAVNIVKKRNFGSLSGFVNGVLRQIDRNKENIHYPSKEDDLVSYLSIMYSVPEWIISSWLKVYGTETTEKIGAALNERAKVCIRVNRLKSSKDELKTLFEKEHIVYEDGALLEEAMYIKNVDNLQALSSFKQGLWTVQDESAMLVAHVLNPKSGDRILDMCSAPGGKSTHLAELMQNEGQIVSADVHAHKLELIEKNAERMGISIINTTLQDGTKLKSDLKDTFDKILLDAPCSGLGIIKRKPDIRYHKNPEDIKCIAVIQKQLAAHAAAYLKQGGTLVYSTCTLSAAENEEIAHYIQEELGLELSDIADTIPSKLRPYIKDKGMIQILPFVADTDGFFIACFKKKEGINNE